MPHSLAVLLDAGRDDRAPVVRRESEVAPDYLEARGEALDVPLPGTGQRLVEVIDVEHQLPFRRTEQSEVRQVGVAAQLHRHARSRGRREVGRHDQRAAAIERAGRHEHSSIPDRDQLRQPTRGLLLQQGDRVRTIGARLPFRVGRPGRKLPSGLPPGDPVLQAETGAAPGRRWRSQRTGRNRVLRALRTPIAIRRGHCRGPSTMVILQCTQPASRSLESRHEATGGTARAASAIAGECRRAGPRRPQGPDRVMSLVVHE